MVVKAARRGPLPSRAAVAYISARLGESRHSNCTTEPASVSISQRRFDIAVTGNTSVDGAYVTRPSIMVIIGVDMTAPGSSPVVIISQLC
ncbi:MAG: hypothetical protein CMN39_00725 [SAR116 cluster bacterium]|nr:hypothetical protein [SAR116 cluster bacterium]